MKRKILTWTLRAVLALVGIIALFCGCVAVRGVPKYDQPKVDLKIASTADKEERGRRMATALCINCHRDPDTGKLSGRRIVDVPPIFGTIVSRNITNDKAKGVGSWSDGELAAMIRTGITRDRTFTPIMGGHSRIADSDLEDIIAWLRSSDPALSAASVDPPGKTDVSFLVKVLTNVAIKPPAYPTNSITRPPAADPVALGRYLVNDVYECYGCHSEDFTTQNHEFPEETPGFFGGGNKLIALDGSPIYTANLTPDPATGIGAWTEEQFRRALIKGVAPNGKALRAPMGQFVGVTEEEANAMFAYLRQIPKISRMVDRRWPDPPPGDSGRAAYVSAGCNSCHGDDGVGYFSLKRVNESFADDGALGAFIMDPQSVRRLAAMPAYETTVDPKQMPDLVKYVRSFGRGKPN